MLSARKDTAWVGRRESRKGIQAQWVPVMPSTRFALRNRRAAVQGVVYRRENLIDGDLAVRDPARMVWCQFYKLWHNLLNRFVDLSAAAAAG